MNRIRSLATIAILTVSAALAGCTSIGTASVPGLAFGTPQRPELPRPAAGSALIAALNGGIIDDGINAQLSPAERNRALQAEYRALEHTPAGETVAWQVRGQSVRGEVAASQPYRVGSQDCRQYTHRITAAGAPVETRGTACRNPDGSWTPLT